MYTYVYTMNLNIYVLHTFSSPRLFSTVLQASSSASAMLSNFLANMSAAKLVAPDVGDPDVEADEDMDEEDVQQEDGEDEEDGGDEAGASIDRAECPPPVVRA
jgi:hypothetical protein